MLYPSPYRAGMSSLGFQWVLHLLREAGISAERAFLPDDLDGAKRRREGLPTYETMTPLGRFPVIGVSLAYELELAGLVQALELAGIPALRQDRGRHDPIIILGGPLTFSNPLPAAPFVDAMLLGEVEDIVADVFLAALERPYDELLDLVQRTPGGFVPARQGDALPAIAKASDQRLPARGPTLAPEAELSDMFLIEGERGCHRQCTFCVMRRSTNGGMRLVSADQVLNFVPEEAKRVGLVGAAISDHPELPALLERIVASGREVGVSSLRADRVALKPDIARLLRAGGYKTLTVASDAASQRLRRTMSKGTTEAHLLTVAERARQFDYKVVKVYMMLGVPDEGDEDIDELITFTKEMAKIHPVALGVAPFVPKRNTPMVNDPFAGIKVVEQRIDRLQRGLAGAAELRPTSARWAWVEWRLAQGGSATGLAVRAAVAGGLSFAAWKQALEAADPEPTPTAPPRRSLPISPA
ncbi:MAG: radical SAM protein [Deltaproteobacteria bacterium]|nr:radical SAM protein [Deltaproteobacteria bacterium]